MSGRTSFELGVQQFQQLPQPPGPAAEEDALGGRSPSTASTDTASPAELLMSSRGASLCSLPPDGIDQDELSRQLTEEIMVEFNQLSCGGAGGDPQQARAPRHSRNASRVDAADGDAAAVAEGECSGGDADEEEEEDHPPPSLYEQLGGGVVCKVLVDGFYHRVLEDPGLERFFVGVDMEKHKRKFLLFVSFVLGGPDEYLQMHAQPWPQLYQVHERLIQSCGLKEAHFDMVVTHLQEALEHLGANSVQVQQALAIVETTRRVIFPLHPPAAAEAADKADDDAQAAEQEQHRVRQAAATPLVILQSPLQCPFRTASVDADANA